MRTTAPNLRVVTEADEGLPRDFSGLFRRYAPYVASIAFRLVGRDDDVDDIVQDVFLVAHRAVHGLRDSRALKGWLRTVTVRAASRKLAKRRVKRALGLDGGGDYEHVASPGLPADTRVLLRRVYDVLDTMPVQERLAWSLRHIEGESIEDVAALCRCSLATANRRIAAAHARIRKELADG